MVHLEYKKQRINNLSKNILLNQMKHSIIKSYAGWLNESLAVHEAETTSDPAALLQKQDRAGLVALAQSKDSEQVKAHPAYAAVMEWWKRGQGDLNLIKSLLKKSKAKQSDLKHSLDSIYAWASGGTNSKANTALTAFYTATDSIIRNSDKLIKLGVDATKIASLKDSISKLKSPGTSGNLALKGGFDKFVPAALVDNMFDDIVISKELDKPEPKPSLVNVLKRNWTQDPKTGYDILIKAKTDAAQVNQYWVGGSTLNDTVKIQLLDLYKKKADDYIARKQKAGTTIQFEQAIATASDLYLMPKGQTITITFDAAAEAPPKPEPLYFSYPPNPNGNEESPEFKQGLSMFPDNGITVTPEAITGIQNTIKQAIDAVKAAGGTITAVKTWSYSSTSQVPTNYTSASGTGNAALAKDRLAAMNKAMADAIAASGITVAPTIDAEKNASEPNRGPAWTDADRNDPKMGKPGARTPEYEAKYGKWRFSAAFFSLEYKVETPNEPKPVQGTPTPSGEWQAFIRWQDESITIPPIKIPGIPGRSPGKPFVPLKNPTACPKW